MPHVFKTGAVVQTDKPEGNRVREIAVPDIPIRIPVLGFGCSSLASVGEKKAQQLLGTAFDAGVRHFDVARYYGYGEAESLLGAFVKSRRSEVTITTKFGIEPPRRTNALRFAMQAGRKVADFVPPVRGFLQRRAQGLVKSGAFAARDAQKSLETSLRELGTDYVDFFLLHDYKVSQDSPEALVEFLSDAVKSGKIRYFGLGTEFKNVPRTLECQPELCSILQFENSVLHQNIKRLPRSEFTRLVITFGSLSASYQSLSAFLRSHTETAKSWSAKLALDCSADEVISALILEFSVRMNPDGLVLFSSRNASRVAANVRAVLEAIISPEQVALFGELVEREFMSTIRTK
jgi:aryl-alcohol dehydrogenase-like predicted oxidoreductase